MSVNSNSVRLVNFSSAKCMLGLIQFTAKQWSMLCGKLEESEEK